MKKIGLVLAYCNNYGTMLQSYATLKKVQSLGYDCEIIWYKKKMSILEKLRLLFVFLRIGDFSGKKRKVLRLIDARRYPDYRKNKQVKDRAFQRFSEANLLPYFKEYSGLEALQKGSENYSLVLVGSDQIWSQISICGHFYNLMFVSEDVPKVSYASSFGVAQIPDFIKPQAKSFLDRMDLIGVREDSGKKIVDSISTRGATVVADPTMLLTPEEWEKEIEHISTERSRPYVFCYFLGTNQEHRRAVEALKEKTGYDIVAVCHNDEYVKSDEGFGDYVPYNVGPLEFLRYIHEADYVCTDSFHCTVFSILFKRQFLSFYRYGIGSKGSRNTRIDNLLSLLHLSDRIYKGDVSVIQSGIDYQKVMEELAAYRGSSLRFLSQELSLAK